MAKVGTGHLRGKRTSQPATAAARRIKAAGNPQVVPMAHDDSPELARAYRALRELPRSSHGGVAPVTGGPASARAPRR